MSLSTDRGIDSSTIKESIVPFSINQRWKVCSRYSLLAIVYQIYAKHRNVPMIFVSHRDYLLCRDIYFATIIIIVFYALIAFLLKTIPFSKQLLALEAVFLICSNIAARQRGKRYVANVIAYDLQEKPKSVFAI